MLKRIKNKLKICTYLCDEFAQIGSDTPSPHSAFILTHALTDSLSSRQIYWVLNGRFPPHAALLSPIVIKLKSINHPSTGQKRCRYI